MQTVPEQLVEAQNLFVTGSYALSKDKLTYILQTQNNNYEALLTRGHANLKLNQLEDAYTDAEALVSNNNSRPEGNVLKGTVLLRMARLDEALSEVERAKLLLSSLDPTDERRVQIQLLEQKVNAEKAKKTTVDVKNLAPKQEEQKTATKENINGHAHYHPQAGKVVYRWRQTDTRVYIDIIFALKKKEDLNLKIDNKRVEISFKIDESRNFDLNLDLFDEVDAEKSLYTVHLDRIEIQLEKANRGRGWMLLEKPESQNEKILESVESKPVNQPEKVSQAAPVYPSSSKVKRDWNKIDKEIDEDIKKHKDDYAEGDQLNAFFKTIYSNADENTRRAMMKSFQTSGGTVLSTNWDEVREKDYESKDRPDAPKGQEWRKWEK